MYKHLKDEIYYSELYDKATIEECLWWEDKERIGKSSAAEEEQLKKDGVDKTHVVNAVSRLSIYYITGERYKKKAETISRWMARDRERDNKLVNTPEPKYIRCLGCSSPMKVESKHLQTDIDDKNDKVLFFFQCDNCNKRRLFWENGEEWKYTPPPCPDCKTALNHSDTREGDIITTTYSCPNCKYTRADTMDLSEKSEKQEEPIDPNFEANRTKYCLSAKEGEEYISWTANLKHFSDMIKDREENKEVFDAIARIKKLTIIEIQNLLNPVIEKAGYTKLEFGKPEITKDLSVEFSVQDNTSGRGEYESVHKLKKLINKTIEETNWRLMSDGISYKLGFLTGRLRGVEGEESLRKLVEKLEKKDKSNDR